MPFARTLPEAVTQVVAEQVGERMSSADGALDSFEAVVSTGTTRLTESFEVWILVTDAADELQEGIRDLSVLARKSGVWHHQIRQEGEAVAFARSMPLGPDPEDWSLREITKSPLARRIDDAIAIADRDVPDQVEVRILSVGFQHVEAFWFVVPPGSEDAQEWNNKLLILMAPGRLSQLEPLKIVSAGEFLEAIATPVKGMGSRPR